MENAWIGGYYNKGFWVWISTGQIIPDKNQTGGDSYPPWFPKSKNKGCLLFDRHLTSSYFLPARCERRRDLICEQCKFFYYFISRALLTFS